MPGGLLLSLKDGELEVGKECEKLLTHLNVVSNDVLVKLATKTNPSQTYIHPPPQGYLNPLPPPALERDEDDAPPFAAITEQPLKPRIRMNQRLWDAIGRHYCPVDEDDAVSIGLIVALASRYLVSMSHDGSDAVRIGFDLKDLLEKAKTIAKDCLNKRNDDNKHLFNAAVVRELQLAMNIGCMVEVELDGLWCRGNLQSFRYPLGDSALQDGYTLQILLDEHRDGLYVIEYWIPLQQ